MPGTIEIEIETDDRQLAYELFKTRALTAETAITLADGSVVRCGGIRMRKGLAFPEVIHAALTVAENVGYGVAGNWLYNLLKDRSAKLRLRRKEVEISPPAIEAALDDGDDPA